MFKLSASSTAALEELLENTIRPVAEDSIAVYLDDQQIGVITSEVAQAIASFQENTADELGLIKGSLDQLILHKTIPDELSLELKVLSEYLRSKNLITGWRDEEFAYLDNSGHESFRLERSVFRTLGLQSRAVHINGYTTNHKIWLARRSNSKFTDPGMLDNLSAGGVSADETIRVCAIREVWEEAGAVASISSQLFPVGVIPVQRPVPQRGLHNELIYTFDLFVPEDWTPINQDGEVSAFELMSFDEALERVLDDQLSPDASIVTADFLLRQSLK